MRPEPVHPTDDERRASGHGYPHPDDVAMTPRDVPVQLTGEDGNVFAIIGRVARALRQAGFADAARAYVTAAMACPSYDAVLRLTMDTVDVR